MSIVRFASICDIPDCGARSAEYSAFYRCSECSCDLCPEHQVEGTVDEETGTALCHDCFFNGACARIFNAKRGSE